MSKGTFIVCTGELGHGDHHGETVFYVKQVEYLLAGSAVEGWQRHEQRADDEPRDGNGRLCLLAVLLFGMGIAIFGWMSLRGQKRESGQERRMENRVLEEAGSTADGGAGSEEQREVLNW